MTDEELKQQFASLNALIEGVKESLEGEIGQKAQELHEQMRDMQTEVLRAFYDWARPVEVRLRHADEIAQRMGLLEDRVSALERGDRPPR